MANNSEFDTCDEEIVEFIRSNENGLQVNDKEKKENISYKMVYSGLPTTSDFHLKYSKLESFCCPKKKGSICLNIS